MSVAVQQVGGSWWNGSAFGGSNPLYSTTTFVGASSGTWSYNSSPAALQGALTSGSTYFIISLSTDIAANPEFGSLAANIPANAGVTVVYDTVAPTAVINVPVLASTSGVISLSITSGGHRLRRCRSISNIQVAVENLVNGLWMDNSFWILRRTGIQSKLYSRDLEQYLDLGV